MKTRYIIILLSFFCTSIVSAQNTLFDKYSNMDDVTIVYISKSMFNLMPNIEPEGIDLGAIKNKIESLQILTSSNETLISKMYDEFNVSTKKEYEELMRIKDEDTIVNFYMKKEKERVNEFLMLTYSKEEFVAIQLVGNFTIDDIQQLTANK